MQNDTLILPAKAYFQEIKELRRWIDALVRKRTRFALSRRRRLAGIYLVGGYAENPILATNELDDPLLSDQEFLKEYKGQGQAERGFRFLKDPTFLAISLYLKKPERIMALLMVMMICLLVYVALQYRIRQGLQAHGETFPDQKGKRASTPTACWVFHYFVGIHLLYVPEQSWPLVLNLREEHRNLLDVLGDHYAWF